MSKEGQTEGKKGRILKRRKRRMPGMPDIVK